MEGQNETENAAEVLSPSRARAERKPGRPTDLTPEVAEKIISWIRNGAFRNQACAEAGITPRTLRNWEKRAAKYRENPLANPDDELFADFVDELEVAQLRSEAKLQIIHYAMSTGRDLPKETGIDIDKVSLHALQFQLERGGTRPFADLKKLELTGKDGERLHGNDVTPAAAAALVRAKFGDHARQALQSEEQAAAVSDTESEA